jgi:magnesium-transporting ATPase (P-type)
MELLTRKNGIWLCVIGIAIFLLNFLTYSLWEFDIDILGAMIFILGLVIAIACGKSMKPSSKLLSRRNGVWLCIIAAVVTAILGYLPIPVLNSEVGGISGLAVFLLGLIIIVVRWKH